MAGTMEAHIESFVNPELGEDVQLDSYRVLSNEVAAGTLSIQDLIVKLEGPLTSVDDKERNRSTLLLAELLNDHPQLTFSSAVIHLLIVFFCRRLSDYPSLVPSLHALTAIVTHHDGEVDNKYFDYVDMFQTIFKDVYVQGLAQNIRQKVFELFGIAFEKPNVLVAAEGIAAEVYTGVLNSFEGEKDPRCLVVALQAMTRMVNGLDKSFKDSDAERLFDCTSCYFPITFQPPSNDPFGITPQQLVRGLLDCLCCHKSLVPHVLPFMVTQLEKSTDTSARAGPPSEGAAARKQGIMCLLQLCAQYSPLILIQTSTASPDALVDLLFDCVTAELKGESTSNIVNPEDFYSLYAIYDICSLTSRYMALSSSSASANSTVAGTTLLWTRVMDVILSKAFIAISDGGFMSIGGRNAFAIVCAVASASTLCAQTVLIKILSILIPLVQRDVQSVNETLVQNPSAASRASGTAHVAMLNELVSSIGTPLNNPFLAEFTAHSHGHSCGSHDGSCSHDHHNGDGAHAVSFMLRNLNPAIDLTTLGASNPLAPHADTLVASLFAVLSNTEMLQTGFVPTAMDVVDGSNNEGRPGNMAGLCEILLCLKSILIRIDPSTLLAVTMGAPIHLLTVLAVTEAAPNAVLLQQCAVAMLSSLAKVHCYRQLLVDHCLQTLIEQTSAGTPNTNSTLAWELLGKLCRISLTAHSHTHDHDTADSGAHGHDGKDSDANAHKKSRSSSPEQDEDDASISEVALPHILRAAVGAGNSTDALAALSYLLPDEPSKGMFGISLAQFIHFLMVCALMVVQDRNKNAHSTPWM
jgi:hypothetical protein